MTFKDLPILEGLWWTPDKPKIRPAGRLVEKDGEAHLILTGSKLEKGGLLNEEWGIYEIIHGQTFDGMSVSLLDCFDLGTGLAAGVEQRIIFVNYVLIGGFVPSKGRFSELSLKWPELNRWFWHSGVHIENDYNKRSFSVSYEPREEIALTLSDGLKLRFDFGTESMPFGGPLADTISIKEVVWVLGTPTNPENIQFFFKPYRRNEAFFLHLCFRVF